MHYQDMMQTTEQTLKAIGVTNIPMIVGYNKADKLLDPIAYPTREGDTLVYSARDEASLMALLAIIKEHIFNDYTTVDLLIPFSDGQIITYLNDNAHVIETNYFAEGTQVKVELTLADASKYAKYQLSSTDKR